MQPMNCCLLSLSCCGQNLKKVKLVINLKNECMWSGQFCVTHLRIRDNAPTAMWFLFSMQGVILLSIYFMAVTFNSSIKMQTLNSFCQILSGNKLHHTRSKARQAIFYVIIFNTSYWIFNVFKFLFYSLFFSPLFSLFLRSLGFFLYFFFSSPFFST